MAQTEEIQFDTEEIQFEPPTAADFERLLKEQTPEYSKWTEIEINKIYTITSTKMVKTQKGELMVLSLYKYGEAWASDHLKSRIIENNLSPSLYIRPRGLKPCKRIHQINTMHMIW